jgi:general secretion pathway protein K
MLYDDKGSPNELWRRFVDSVSLYDFTQPNVNGAPDTTLAVLGGYDDTGVKIITDYLGGLGSYARQGPAYFRTTQDVTGLVGQAANSARFGTQVRCLRINVTVHEGQSSFRLSAVMAPPNGAELPPSDQPPPSVDASATQSDADSTAAGAPAAASAATATTDTTSPQTQPVLNYPFTLLEIRENDEIVGTFPASQPASD